MFPVLDKGFAQLLDSMGNDYAPDTDARLSTGVDSRNEVESARLLRFLLRHKHTTPFEGCIVKFKVKAPIMVIREWFRHRTFCLSGDSELYFDLPENGTLKRKHRLYKMTLMEAYDKWNSPQPIRLRGRTNKEYKREQLSKMLLRSCNENTGDIEHVNINDIVYSGVKSVFEIELDNGYKIKMSKDHLCFTENGWMKFEQAVGLHQKSNTNKWDWRPLQSVRFATNGSPAYLDKGWLSKQRRFGLSVDEIASNAGVSYHTIRKYLRIFNLQFSAKEKAQLSGLNQRGKRRKSKPHVMSEDGIRSIKLSRSGSNSNFWKGGISSNRENIARWTTEQAPKVHARNNYVCVLCNEGGNLHAHHIDPVWNNENKAYDFENLTSLCTKCHNKIHVFNLELQLLEEFEHGKKLPMFWANYNVKRERNPNKQLGIKKLIVGYNKVVDVRYVGEEKTYDLSVSGNFHNFVANGFVVHNSYNEESGRYKQLDPNYYVPDVSRVAKQATTNRQGSGEVFTEAEAKEQIERWISEQSEFEGIYVELCNEDGTNMAKELARLNMPVSHYSTFVATGNLLNWYRFLQLRMAPGAQFEIRQYANLLFEIIKCKFPICTQAFEDYWLNAITFSAQEIQILKGLFFCTDALNILEQSKNSEPMPIKGREFDEFMAKIKKIEG